MLNNISWASYAIALSIFLCVYYAFVLVRYYRHDLHQYAHLLKGRRDKFLSFGVQRRRQPVFEMDVDDLKEQVRQGSIPELQLQLQSIIKNGAARKYPKEELLVALKLHLKQQVLLPGESDKETINNYIKAQFENYCFIHLSGEDERVLWVD
jgi:hypothetical protein